MRWPLQPLQPLQEAQLQPPFGPSVNSLCRSCITTPHLSYSVLSLKLPPPPCAVLLVIVVLVSCSCSCLSVCLSIYLFLSLCLSVCVSVYPAISLSIYVSIYVSIYPSIYLSVYLSMYLSIYLSAYLQAWKQKLVRVTSSIFELGKIKSALILWDFLNFWARQRQKRSYSARIPQFFKLTTSKTKQFCETSFNNGKLNVELTASYQWFFLRFFQSMPPSYCAWHEEVGPGHTKYCTRHAKSS